MVTKAKAEKVLSEVKKAYFAKHYSELDQPKLVKDWSFLDCGKVPYAIIWEGGPYQWTYEASEKVQVPGVYVEPYTTWSLAINE